MTGRGFELGGEKVSEVEICVFSSKWFHGGTARFVAIIWLTSDIVGFKVMVLGVCMIYIVLHMHDWTWIWTWR